MRSFDIFVDGRLIQSDLIVVNLPLRNDIAAYSWMVIDSRLINHMIAEKAVSPVDNSGGIAFDVKAKELVTNYETVYARPVTIDASAEFYALFPLDIEENRMEISQQLQEISQKFETVSLPISVGVDDALIIMPLKSTGHIENTVVFGSTVSEVKNAIIDGENGYGGIITDAVLKDPAAVYYEKADIGMAFGLDVRSLSYLMHLRLIQNAVNIGANVVDFDLYRSLGKLPARIAIGAEASFLVTYFTDGANALSLLAEANAVSHKIETVQSGVALSCSGLAILRRMRLLEDVDAFGTLADIDSMTLDDMCYEVVQE